MNIAANLLGWYWMGYRLADKYIKLSQNPRKSRLILLQDFVCNNGSSDKQVGNYNFATLAK